MWSMNSNTIMLQAKEWKTTYYIKQFNIRSGENALPGGWEQDPGKRWEVDCGDQLWTQSIWITHETAIRHTLQPSIALHKITNLGSWDSLQSPPPPSLSLTRPRYCIFGYVLCVYRKSSAENMPLALRRMESLEASYGCSLEGISSTAGMDSMCWSMAWRIISAMNWLIRMMPMSLRVRKLLWGGGMTEVNKLETTTEHYNAGL